MRVRGRLIDRRIRRRRIAMVYFFQSKSLHLRSSLLLTHSPGRLHTRTISLRSLSRVLPGGEFRGKVPADYVAKRCVDATGTGVRADSQATMESFAKIAPGRVPRGIERPDPGFTLPIFMGSIGLELPCESMGSRDSAHTAALAQSTVNLHRTLVFTGADERRFRRMVLGSRWRSRWSHTSC